MQTQDPNVVTVERRTAASPAALWQVLSDGWAYAAWVVGASRVRDVDATWPAPGARIHHSVGLWPVLLDDTTVVERSTTERELVLTARGWPVGEAGIVMTLTPDGDGCVVRMDEDAVRGPGVLVPQPIRQALIAPRNAESLRRLEYLASGRERR